MPVNTVTSDPRRVSAQQPIQQQTFATTSNIEANNRDYQRPRTNADSDDSPVYVLTLLTDPEHQRCMSGLRRAYFPRKLNKVESHITLFHALPEERLEQEIIPEIEAMTARMRPYRMQVTKSFRMSKGVGLSVVDDIDSPNQGQNSRGNGMTKTIRHEFQQKWSAWLSEQDSGFARFHYTIMNKVSDTAVIDKCLADVGDFLKQGSAPTSIMHSKDRDQNDLKDEFNEDQEPLKLIGNVTGLTLWRYTKKGYWVDPRHFEFRKGDNVQTST